MAGSATKDRRGDAAAHGHLICTPGASFVQRHPREKCQAMNGRSVRWTFAVAAVAVLAIVVAWVYPGYFASTPGTPLCPAHPTAFGRVYCAQIVSLERYSGGAILSCGSGGFVFQGVTFGLDFFFDGTPGDLAYVSGWINSSTVPCVAMALVGNPLGPSSVNWSGPDHSVYLLWHAPFASYVDGTYVANVSCGVYLGP